MLYRRYSTDAFVAPPYRESFPVEHEQQSRQGGGQGGGGGGHSGRGMRSYSMEYGNFPGRPGRSQSMEGEQMFAEGPAAGYPSLSRSNSAGVSFDWPRGRMDVAPPLPPDARPSSGSGGHYATSPRPEAYYDVEFKRGRQEVFAGRAIYNPGEYVKVSAAWTWEDGGGRPLTVWVIAQVEADRGEDIGRIVQRTTDLAKIHGDAGGADDAVASRPKRHDLPVKKIIGVASQRECEMLSEQVGGWLLSLSLSHLVVLCVMESDGRRLMQRKEEQDVFEVCKSKVRQRLLPMNVIDAEYQFDRHKLTFFFEAERCVALLSPARFTLSDSLTRHVDTAAASTSANSCATCSRSTRRASGCSRWCRPARRRATATATSRPASGASRAALCGPPVVCVVCECRKTRQTEDAAPTSRQRRVGRLEGGGESGAEQTPRGESEARAPLPPARSRWTPL